MKEINLTNGGISLVDDDDYDYLIQWKWNHHNHDCNIIYARRSMVIDGKRIDISMHRLIMGNPVGMMIDHIDHNGLNNQKSNLRICDHTQNMCNRRGFGKSKFLGVYKEERKNRWRAQLRHNGKLIRSGLLRTEEQAALFYDELAKKYHGKFANLNFK
jgi:hypothetical protein